MADQMVEELVAALDEDARHIHIIDHDTTRRRIKFEDCPSAYCTDRRELIAKASKEAE